MRQQTETMLATKSQCWLAGESKPHLHTKTASDKNIPDISIILLEMIIAHNSTQTNQ